MAINQWITGPAGSGKTRYAEEHFLDGNAFLVGFDDVFLSACPASVQTVIFADLRPKQVDPRNIALFKALASGEAVQVPTKHRDSKTIGPVQMVVTSPYSIPEVFPEDWQELLPLFAVVQMSK